MSLVGILLLIGLLFDQTRLWSVLGLLLIGAFLAYPIQSTIAAVIIGSIYIFTQR